MSESNRVRMGTAALGFAYTALALAAFAGFGAMMARFLM
jgi:hypothetical protein